MNDIRELLEFLQSMEDDSDDALEFRNAELDKYRDFLSKLNIEVYGDKIKFYMLKDFHIYKTKEDCVKYFNSNCSAMTHIGKDKPIILIDDNLISLDYNVFFENLSLINELETLLQNKCYYHDDFKNNFIFYDSSVGIYTLKNEISPWTYNIENQLSFCFNFLSSLDKIELNKFVTKILIENNYSFDQFIWRLKDNIIEEFFRNFEKIKEQ